MMIDPGLLYQFAANPESGVALAPHWGWYVILYFFLGGLAGGVYFIATMLAMLGDPRDHETVRLGYVLAFPLVLICGLLLIVDLGVPLRFWHMLVQSQNVPAPMFKSWSPISIGSWILTVFGFFSFVSFIGVQVEGGRIRWGPLARLDEWARRRPRPMLVFWGILGAFFGFFLAGYTGVLVVGTSIPFWHNARLMGALFLASAASSSYALLILLLMRRGMAHRDVTVAKLVHADRWAIALEMLILFVMLLLLGDLARPVRNGGFGVVFWLGVVVIGLLLPIAVHAVKVGNLSDERRARVSAACVLVGALLLRFVVVMAPQWPAVPLWYL